jgi:hypothetical protein
VFGAGEQQPPVQPDRIGDRAAAAEQGAGDPRRRSGKYVIERGDGPPSTVKDRTEDHGCTCLCTPVVIKQCVPSRA